MSKVLVAGGGAAGMFAAITAARNGHQVHLFEKNEKLGKKLFITGKGRCNITNACDPDTFFTSVVTNSKFMYSSFYGYTNYDVIDFMESLGVKTKIERGNRVFPVSDHSSDVIRALTRELERLGVSVHYHKKVTDIVTQDGQFKELVFADHSRMSGDAVIVAVGGQSYPTTGSTGDGYRWAERLGHHITEILPALVPLETKENYVRELQGLSLKNIEVSIYDEKKELYREFGEMLFTHYGVSGPVILSASSYAAKRLLIGDCRLEIDLKPALTPEQLDQRILREFNQNLNKQFKNAVKPLFPAKLLPVILEVSEVDPDKQVNSVSKEERTAFAALIKHFPMTISGLRGFNEAIITKGGIMVKEIDPATMESKLVSGVYFTGEMLDLDGLTGGFNLQIAWSTAYAAGNAIN